MKCESDGRAAPGIRGAARPAARVREVLLQDRRFPFIYSARRVLEGSGT